MLAGRALGRLGVQARGSASTPVRLRLASLATVALAVVFGLLAAFGVDRREGALQEVRDAAGQLIDVQDIQVRLVHADALVSENFLRAGAEDPQLRAQYVAEMQAATEGLTRAAGDVPGEAADALATVSADVAKYAGLVEQARANNRQGYPLGAAYLRAASAVMSERIVPDLRAVQADLRERVNERLDRADRAGVWLPLTGAVLLAALVAGGAWLARRFKRVLNVPLVVAAAVLLVLLVAGAASQGVAMSDAEAATGGDLRAADVLAQARAAGFDARSREAETLINRGNSADAAARWAEADTDAALALSVLCDRYGECDPQTEYERYRGAYAAVRSLDDDEGRWDDAVAASLGDAAQAFSAFADPAGDRVEFRAANALGDLDDAAGGLGALRVFCFLGAAAVAVLAASGYGQRAKEYR